MTTAAETYKKLADAVRELRIAIRAAKRRTAENEKLPLAKREAGRGEYVKVLLDLQANAQAVLDSTDDPEGKPVQTSGSRSTAR